MPGGRRRLRQPAGATRRASVSAPLAALPPGGPGRHGRLGVRERRAAGRLRQVQGEGRGAVMTPQALGGGGGVTPRGFGPFPLLQGGHLPPPPVPPGTLLQRDPSVRPWGGAPRTVALAAPPGSDAGPAAVAHRRDLTCSADPDSALPTAGVTRGALWVDRNNVNNVHFVPCSCICIYKYMYIFIYVCVYVYIYVCACVLYVYIYACVYFPCRGKQ